MELLDDKMRVWLESAKFVKAIPGVYVLYNRNKEPIFIGETNNLETTFTKYVDTEFEGNECMQKTSSYQRVFTNNQKQCKIGCTLLIYMISCTTEFNYELILEILRSCKTNIWC